LARLVSAHELDTSVLLYFLLVYEGILKWLEITVFIFLYRITGKKYLHTHKNFSETTHV